MDILLIIIGIVLLIGGIIGCVAPVIPGPPISYIALILLQLTSYKPFTTSFLVIWLIIVLFITIADYFIPIWGTKKMGGTKFGTWGSTIGLIVSVIVLPFLGITLGPFGLIGIIAGPFAGAFIGEKIYGQSSEKAFKAAMGSFLGFLVGTILKFAICIIIAIQFLVKVFGIVF
ncbi:MAG: DUF456 domain-containing protein [Bacteroidota bacterium]